MVPKKAYDKVYEAAGGSTTISNELRDTKQAYRAKSEDKTEKQDEMFELLEQLKSDQQKPDRGFLKRVQFSDTPEAVLASTQQLADIS